MEPGSPSLLWGMRASKPVTESKGEDRAASPGLAERLAAAPSSPPAPPSPAPPQHQFQAALVAEKYLLLEQVEGSSLCRCLDVRTQEEYVCKVSPPPITFVQLESAIKLSIGYQCYQLIT